MSSADPGSYGSFFDADLSEADEIFLGPLQEQLHKETTPRALAFVYALLGLSLYLNAGGLTALSLAVMLGVALLLTVTRPTAFWARMGISTPQRRIIAQSIVAAAAMLVFLAYPIAAQMGGSTGPMAALAIATVIFGPIAYAFTPVAARCFAMIATPGFAVAFLLASREAQRVEYALVIFLSGFITMTVCTLIHSSFAARFVRERDLREAADTVKMLLHDYESHASDWLWEVDSNGRFTNYNSRGLEATGRSPEELAAVKPLDMLHREVDRARVIEALRTRKPFRKIEVAVMVNGEERWWSLSGTPQFDADGTFIRTRGVCSDVTETKQAEAQIAYMARYDALTDLPNRAMFAETLSNALRRRRDEELVAVLYLDLDQFKAINDTLGHAVGDEVLRVAARRIGSCLGVRDIVSRQGGDEFAVLLYAPASRKEVDAVAAAIIAAMAEPAIIEGHHVTIGASIGIAFAPADADKAEDLIKRADLALYHSKQNGRGLCSHFAMHMQKSMLARRQIETDLRGALGKEQFELHYQPLVNLETGRAAGYEALLRWQHPKRGMIAPDHFIPIAEDTGLIVPIGEWVLRTALAEVQRWPDHLSVSVNLSPVQVQHPGLVAMVVNALAQSGVAPHRLELEITERVLMRDTETNMRVLHQLRSLGVQIALDDFGTGYSSLNYLRGFPFDKIKIDRCFVNDIDSREDNRAIIRAVTTLASSLGMITTAEGVEREQELAMVRAEGCTEVQGYFLSRPVPASAIPDRKLDDTVARRAAASRRRRAG